MSQQIEKTLESREVAEMIEKTHSELLKDIRRYIGQFNAGNLPFVEFFRESTYNDSKGELRPCYQVTEKGCEFIAHKLTGTKGTIFTARYINRFHEMQDVLSMQNLPWFIREFRGDRIMLFRDFKTITGVELLGDYTSCRRVNRLIGGLEYNGWDWRCNREAFNQEYGFDYGDSPCMMYLHLCGISKALNIYAEDRKNKDTEAYRIISDGLKLIEKSKKKKSEILVQNPIVIPGNIAKEFPVQINIIMNGNAKAV